MNTTTSKNGPAKILPAPPAPARMTLAGVRKGRLQSPLRVLLYGVEGVGKSTFAASAPDPIFLCSDAGTAHLDIARLPEPGSWAEVLDGVRLLQRESHEYKTLVLDPVNWCEGLLHAHLCAKNSWSSIEDPGFGKGYTAALESWRELVVELERLWSTRGMHIVLLAHSTVKLFKNPEGDDFERYQIAMHEKAAGVLKQWCDVVLFAKHEAFAKRDSQTKRVRGVSTGARVVHTQWSAAFDAKNRHNLPEELPLSWRAFTEAVSAGRERAVELRARIEALLAELGDESVTKNARNYMAQAGDDVAMLAEIENAAAMKLNERQSQQPQAQQTTGTNG